MKYEFITEKCNFHGVTGYWVSQIRDEKRVVEQFIPEEIYMDFCKTIGVVPEVITQEENVTEKITDEEKKQMIVDYYSTNNRYVYNKKYSTPGEDVYTKENDICLWLTLEQKSPTQIEVRQTNSLGEIVAWDNYEITGNIPKYIGSDRASEVNRSARIYFNQDALNIIYQYGKSSKEEICRNISDILPTIDSLYARDIVNITLKKLKLLSAESCEAFTAVIKRWKNKEEADKPTLNSSMTKNTETNVNKEMSDSEYPVMDAGRRRGR